MSDYLANFWSLRDLIVSNSEESPMPRIHAHDVIRVLGLAIRNNGIQAVDGLGLIVDGEKEKALSLLMAYSKACDDCQRPGSTANPMLWEESDSPLQLFGWDKANLPNFAPPTIAQLPVRRNKLRRNSLDIAFDEILKANPEMKFAELWHQLTEMAIKEENVFKGQEANGDLVYTENRDKKTLTKDAARKRLECLQNQDKKAASGR